nr:PREDICTED: uncharacterized protein LOC109559908 [Bos indicus]
MLPPRKITIQPTAFLEGPSDVHGGSAPARSRRLGGQAVGRLRHAHPERNKAVQRGNGVGPVRSGSPGAGRWRACVLVLGGVGLARLGAISGLLGDQHALVCQPGRLQALLVGAALDPSPHPSHTPFEHKLWELGSKVSPGPPAGVWTPVSHSEHSPGPRPPMPPQIQCLTGARKSPVLSGQFRVALNVGVPLRSACPPSVHSVSAGVSGCLPVAAAGLSPGRQPRC